MDFHLDWLVLLTFGLSFTMSIVSGIGGGGGGFILIPYFIFIGLTPQQAVATIKMNSLGTTFGAMTAFRGKGLVNKKYIVAFLAITSLCALLSAWLIPRIDGAIFQQVIGWTLLILTPTVFIKKASLQPGPRSKSWIIAGFIAYIFVTFAQTLLSTGIGSLLVLVLMFLFGLSALEANATKRVAQVSQAIILFVLLLIQGFVVIWHGVAAMVGAIIGSHIGGKIAIKKGEGYVKVALAAMMLVSGVALILMP